MHFKFLLAPLGYFLYLCKILGNVWFGGMTEGSTEVQFIGDDLYNRVTLGGMVHNHLAVLIDEN